MRRESTCSNSIAVEDVVVRDNESDQAKAHQLANETTPKATASITPCSRTTNDQSTNTEAHGTSPTPTLSCRSKNHSIASRSSSSSSSHQHSQSTKRPSVKHGPNGAECELHEMSHRRKHSRDSHEIEIVENPVERLDRACERKLWNPSKASIEHGINDVDVDHEESGCYNPTFTQSETTVSVDIDNDEVTVSKSNSNQAFSSSRQNSLSKRNGDTSEKDPNVKNVL